MERQVRNGHTKLFGFVGDFQPKKIISVRALIISGGKIVYIYKMRRQEQTKPSESTTLRE